MTTFLRQGRPNSSRAGKREREYSLPLSEKEDTP